MVTSRWRAFTGALHDLFFGSYGLSGFGMAVTLVGGAVALTVVILAVTFTIDGRNCSYAGRQLHRATRYDRLAGCFVDIGGESVPLDQYRATRTVR